MKRSWKNDNKSHYTIEKIIRERKPPRNRGRPRVPTKTTTPPHRSPVTPIYNLPSSVTAIHSNIRASAESRGV